MSSGAADGWDIRPARSVADLMDAAHLFDDPVTEASAADYLSRPGHRLLLARDPSGRPIGFVSTVVVVHPDKGPEQLIYELAVDEGRRRQGVATALLAAVTGTARAVGDRGVWVLTEPDNAAALATYRAAGATREDTVILTWDFEAAR